MEKQQTESTAKTKTTSRSARGNADEQAEAQATTNPIRTKIQTVQAELGAGFAERDRVVEGLILSALAREHILLLGPPGTAKSAMANAFCGSVKDAKFFAWLLTRFSAPEEVFGPVSLSALKLDRFARVVTGKLPEANVAFLDEIFKANSAVLNALLTAINERVFYDDGRSISIPLMTVVGASNELPEGPELGALYDRFLTRFWVGYTQTPDAFRRVLLSGETGTATKVTLAEWEEAQSEVLGIHVPTETITRLFDLRAELGKAGIQASDRRWKKLLNILRAAAWLAGDPEASTEYFPVLANCLWHTPDQFPGVQAAVSKFAAPEVGEATTIHDAALELIAQLPAPGSPDYTARLVPTHRELKRSIDRMAKLAEATKAQTAKRKINALRDALVTKAETVRKSAREELGL